jgi:Flp pilus assembly pilin Flp
MKRKLAKLLGKLRNKSGVSLTEYAFILVIVSIVAIAILEGIGGKTNNMVSSVNDGFVP